jgi:vitellogenic carboxypeptidase-like protein
MIGLFYEMGPLKLNSKAQLVRNPDTWNLHADMLFIDSPVGTGFSYVGSKNKTTGPEDDEFVRATSSLDVLLTSVDFENNTCVPDILDMHPKFEDGYVANEAAVAHDLVLFMDRFYRIFPELLQSKLYLTGESYAGKYIPAFASQIHNVNQYRPANGIPAIPMAGFAIGNGLTDPITQVTTHANHALALGLVSSSQAQQMKVLEDMAVKLICVQNWKEALQARNLLFDLVGEASGNINYYDVRQGSNQYHRKEMYRFLRDKKTKVALNVGKDAMFAKDWNLYPHLEDDIMKSAAGYLPPLLDYGYRVVLYQGQFDFRDGIMSQNEWISQLTWKGQKEFNEAARTVWKEKNSVAGYITRFSNLIRVEVSNAGHLAPGDQGYNTLQMIEKYVLE